MTLPTWLLTFTAWCIVIAGVAAILCAIVWILAQIAYLSVLGLQRVARAVGVYDDFWHWYKEHGRLFQPRRLP